MSPVGQPALLWNHVSFSRNSWKREDVLKLGVVMIGIPVMMLVLLIFVVPSPQLTKLESLRLFLVRSGCD